ncbi:hypothetical protein B0H16DRAFT_1744246 [Mycena metata]|uniref:Uncharacterized protein n=1 Tax=Mycena metata TaxID=1033252 RepID=A0AAD7H4R0_9AGAR|nr:hypothetical protein B0H16DRAFT_1744246 [Mycena metata]
MTSTVQATSERNSPKKTVARASSTSSDSPSRGVGPLSREESRKDPRGRSVFAQPDGVENKGTTTMLDFARARLVHAITNGAPPRTFSPLSYALVFVSSNRELLAQKQRDARKHAYIKKNGVHVYRKYSDKPTTSQSRPPTPQHDEDDDAVAVDAHTLDLPRDEYRTAFIAA